MNLRILFKLNGIILLILTMTFLISAGIALLIDPAEWVARSSSGFLYSALITGFASGLAFWLSRGARTTLYSKEAIAIVGTGWLLASMVGALPFWFIMDGVSLVDAFFESASGLTTTGASVLSNLEQIAPSLHFWRSISQWIGGLGVVVFFVAILSFLGAAAKVLFSRESSANYAELRASRIQSGVVRLIYLYLGISIACTVAYHLCGLSWWDALLHMFTTVSTGGFSNRTGSLADFANPALEWTSIAFMAIGGTSFVLMLEIFRGNLRAAKQSSEFKAYLLLLVSASLIIAGFLLYDQQEAETFTTALRTAAFQVVSIMTTTGFATADFDTWLPVTHVLLFLLMFIGGCAGSTSGGTKVIRFLVAAMLSRQQIEKAYHQRVVRPLKVNGRHLSPQDQEMIAVYLVLLALLCFGSVFIVAMMEPLLSFEGTLSAMAACLFNIGPGFAEVGPSQNFAQLHDVTKIFLSLIMIIGRLELFAFLALFSPGLWKRF